MNFSDFYCIIFDRRQLRLRWYPNRSSHSGWPPNAIIWSGQPNSSAVHFARHVRVYSLRINIPERLCTGAQLNSSCGCECIHVCSKGKYGHNSSWCDGVAKLGCTSTFAPKPNIVGHNSYEYVCVPWLLIYNFHTLCTDDVHGFICVNYLYKRGGVAYAIKGWCVTIRKCMCWLCYCVSLTTGRTHGNRNVYFRVFCLWTENCTGIWDCGLRT